MGEILFRGKRKDNGEWVEGKGIDLNFDVPYILTKEYDCGTGYYMDELEVIPETVGQYTGLTDKNGKKIFEGDIVQSEIDGGAYNKFMFPAGVVVFENGAFCIKDKKEVTPLASYSPRVNIEIIGNIHDNPGLLN